MPMTSAQRKALKARLKKRSRKSLEGRAVPPSEKIDDFYERQLVRIARTLKVATQAAMIPILNRERNSLNDADPLVEAVNKLERTFKTTAFAEAVAKEVAAQSDQYNKTLFLKSVKDAVGIDASDILSDKKLKRALDKSINANIRLIKSIPKEHFSRVRAAILQGRKKADTDFSIRKSIQKISGITENRAKLIARDQVSKINASLNELRQRDIGVTHYRWRTAGDKRVRASHAANEGRIFAWDKPPPTGHPGAAVNCRCDSEPMFDGIF